MPSYLVIGGAGFIGSHLVEALVQRGDRVRVLDNLSFGSLENLAKVSSKIEFTRGEASDPETVRAAVRGAEGVFHLASTSSVRLSFEDPLLNQRSGEIATLAGLTESSKAGVRRFVFSSSAAVYGDSPEEPKHEDLAPRPKSPYAVSKAVSEIYARLLAKPPDFDTVSLRYFNVFGPRQRPSSPYSGVISIFLDCLSRRVVPVIYGDGWQTRDFISVHDVVSANLLAMNHARPLKGECFNVATGKSVSVLEVLRLLGDVTGIHAEPRFEKARPGDILHSSASIEKIQQALGFAPARNFRDELRALAEVYEIC